MICFAVVFEGSSCLLWYAMLCSCFALLYCAVLCYALERMKKLACLLRKKRSFSGISQFSATTGNLLMVVSMKDALLLLLAVRSDHKSDFPCWVRKNQDREWIKSGAWGRWAASWAGQPMSRGIFYCFVTLKGGLHNLGKDLSIHNKKRWWKPPLLADKLLKLNHLLTFELNASAHGLYGKTKNWKGQKIIRAFFHSISSLKSRAKYRKHTHNASRTWTWITR